MAIQVTEPGRQRTLDALNAPALRFDLDSEVGRLWEDKTAHLRMHVRQGLEKEPIDLPAGQLLVLDQGVPHEIEALADSAFLLTVAWPGERPQALSAASSATRVTVRRIRR